MNVIVTSGEQAKVNLGEADMAVTAARAKCADKPYEHRRFGHFFVDSGKVCGCLACKMFKDQGGVGHAQKRPKYLKPTKLGVQVNWDHCGPWTGRVP